MGLWILRGMTTGACSRPYCGGNLYFYLNDDGELEQKCLLCSRTKGLKFRVGIPCKLNKSGHHKHIPGVR